jgi:hypothetical protein
VEARRLRGDAANMPVAPVTRIFMAHPSWRLVVRRCKY